MGDGNKNFYESMPTSTALTNKPTAFDQKAFQKALEAMPGAVDIPLFFTSKLLDPDACFKMDSKNWWCLFDIHIYSRFDKNTKTVYVCGKNVRDALIKKGVAFQNYKPTGGEERNEHKP